MVDEPLQFVALRARLRALAVQQLRQLRNAPVQALGRGRGGDGFDRLDVLERWRVEARNAKGGRDGKSECY